MQLVVFILTKLLRSSMLLAESAIVLSSSKLHIDSLPVVTKISFIKILKKSGSKFDLCGTPWFREPYMLKYPLNFTDCFLSVK